MAIDRFQCGAADRSYTMPQTFATIDAAMAEATKLSTVQGLDIVVLELGPPTRVRGVATRHGWRYVTQCAKCKGTGTWIIDPKRSADCPACHKRGWRVLEP